MPFGDGRAGADCLFCLRGVSERRLSRSRPRSNAGDLPTRGAALATSLADPDAPREGGFSRDRTKLDPHAAPLHARTRRTTGFAARSRGQRRPVVRARAPGHSWASPTGSEAQPCLRLIGDHLRYQLVRRSDRWAQPARSRPYRPAFPQRPDLCARQCSVPGAGRGGRGTLCRWRRGRARLPESARTDCRALHRQPLCRRGSSFSHWRHRPRSAGRHVDSARAPRLRDRVTVRYPALPASRGKLAIAPSSGAIGARAHTLPSARSCILPATRTRTRSALPGR